MRKLLETQKRTFQIFADRKTILPVLGFILSPPLTAGLLFLFVEVVIMSEFAIPRIDTSSTNIVFSGSRMSEGEGKWKSLVGLIDHRPNEDGGTDYFLTIDYDPIIIYTMHERPITDSDIPILRDQTTVTEYERIVVYEAEIVFTEQCSEEKLLDIFGTFWPALAETWPVIAQGVLFYRTLDNGQIKFTYELERIRLNG